MALFSASNHSGRYPESVYLITEASDCGHVVKTVSLGFFHGKLTLFPFLLNKYLMGRVLETAHIPFLTLLLPTSFSIHRWFLAATVILRCVPNGVFHLLLFHLLNGISIRKYFPFSSILVQLLTYHFLILFTYLVAQTAPDSAMGLFFRLAPVPLKSYAPIIF